MDAPVASGPFQRGFADGVGLFEELEIDIFERNIVDWLVPVFPQDFRPFRGSDNGVGKSYRYRAGKRLYGQLAKAAF